MQVRRVILNADDMGRSTDTNAAILRAHTQGLLTSASLMVGEAASAEAVEMARDCPSLAVGLHLTLSDGLPALPPGAVPGLAGCAGRFRDSPAAAGLVMFFRAGARREARAEVEEQFARFAAAGLPFDHVNGHQHLHLHPVVWDALVAQCRRHNVGAIRVPHEEYRPRGRDRRAARRLEWTFFRALRRRCLRSLAGTGVVVADRVYGHLETGRITEGYVLDLLPHLGGATNEVYCHPGAARGAIGGRDPELDCLTSPRVRTRLEELGIERTTYGRLAESLAAGVAARP